MAMQNEIKEYIKSVKKQIVCPTAESRQMLRELQANVSDFVQENPDADMVQIVEQFGKPETIANLHLANMSKNRITKAVNTRKVVVTAVVIALAMLAITFSVALYDNHKTEIVFYNDTIIEGTTALFSNFK
ncbi:MAG: hypothetical protein IJA31_06285 [Clostridia bacterium]|nr:hypothetical protein [Clostridia bacterium]MBQ6864957.1 hypothetical protein [Clostridia bacterium]